MSSLSSGVAYFRFPTVHAPPQYRSHNYSSWTLADDSSARDSAAWDSAAGYRNIWADMRAFLKDPMFEDDEDIGLQLAPEDMRFQGGSAFRGLNMTCDWFRAAGSHVISLPHVTFTDPKNMSSAEFIKCIPLFAEFNWPRSHRDSLWERVKKEVGFPSPPEMETMGFLLLSMSEFELRQIDFSSSLDLLWSFGSLDGWSEVQLKSLAQQFAMTVGSPPEKIDAVRLVSLGYILCGISAHNVIRMNTGAYLRASIAIGELEHCDSQVLQALASLAKQPEAYGDVPKWDSATLASIGIVAAGLNPFELRQLSPMSLNGLNCAAVRAFNRDQMQAFTASQMQFLNADAALCVRHEQIPYLSEAQRFAIYEAGSDVLELVGRRSDSSSKFNPIKLHLILLLLFLFVIKFFT